MNYLSNALVFMTKLAVRIAVRMDHTESMNRSTTTCCVPSKGADSDMDASRAPIMSVRLDLLLQFQNLTYTVQHADGGCRTCTRRRVSLPDLSQSAVHENEVKLLDNVSGKVRSGEIMAIMGPSGSGKSTLIDALAQRIASESLQGSISLNGEEVKTNSIIRKISAYVMQDDLLFPMLTVKETLRFAAELRLVNSSSEKNARVEKILSQLNLTRVANTIIGDEGHRGVSGGERRRVSIGKEIVHDPLLLFLDEPTSGLDSTNALLVVSTLKKIASTGSVVLLSVHQPSERILNLITTVLFIAEGQVIYRGPPANIRHYFEGLGYSIPEGTNTTEYALDLAQEFTLTPRTGIAPLVQSFRGFAEGGDYRTPLPSYDRTSSMTGDPEAQLPTGVRGVLAASIAKGKLIGATGYLKLYSDSQTSLKKFANSSIYEMYVLAWRGLLNTRRTPELFIMRFATVLVAGFLLSTIFWKLDYSPEGLKERLSFYAFATSTTFYICVDTLPIFLQERHIFMRETSHDSYRISSYVVAIAVINIPFLFFLAFAFCTTTFWTVGLSGGPGGYLFFLIVVWASFWAGNSFATLLSGAFTSVITGYTVVVAALAYFLLLSGFFITRTRIPRYWLWLHYFSVIKYPYEAVLLNEFDGSSSACFETGEQILYGTSFAGSDVVAESVLSSLRPMLQSTKYRNLNGSTCIMDGPAVLRGQDIVQLSKWGCLAITISFGVIYRLLFYVILRLTGKSNRR